MPVMRTKVQHQYGENGNIDEYSRILKRQSGVYISLRGIGTVGRLSVTQILFALTAFLALIKISRMVVDEVIVRVYMRFGMKHVSHLFEVYRNDVSPEEAEFKT